MNGWGGVTIAYRRRLIDSPSYTLNHEEIEKALEEGIRFAEGLTQQMSQPDIHTMSFEERLGLLVDAEWTAREERKLARRLRAAKLRHQASLEDVDFKHPRRLDRHVAAGRPGSNRYQPGASPQVCQNR